MQGSSEEEDLERIIAQYVQAVERGHTPNRQQFIEQHAQYADELAVFFQVHDEFNQASESSLQAPPQDVTQFERSPEGAAAATPSATNYSSVSNPPKELGQYEILREIDRGGMGVVYQAKHKELGRIVALKVIRSGELASEEEVQRFRSEAEAAATLDHPGIVPIYEVGTLNGLVYYTMAYIEGQSLAQMGSSGPMDPMQAVTIVHKLCEAVAYAHRKGVFHRDLKPANVIVRENGQPIIIDFGLAKIAHHESGLTATGQLLGTPAYMAPENASGEQSKIGANADVYALGAILYFLCAGQPAFTGRTPFDVLLQVLDSLPSPPSRLNRQVDSQLDYVCLRSLEKTPTNRYRSARAFSRELAKILTGEPIECPQDSYFVKMQRWWQRDPILAAHVAGIGTTTIIVAIAYVWRAEPAAEFRYRMLLLFIWMLASFMLQYGVYRAPLREVVILAWLAVDATIYTTLIAFADSPRSMLLIGYPMMIVASSLFYQRRFLVTTTLLSIAGFLVLASVFPKDDFVKPDFAAIFLTGLIVISLCLFAVIRRVRGLSRFYDDSRQP